MKILYLDCFAGISGDMTLGAFLDLGVSEKALRNGFAQLKEVSGYELKVEKAIKSGITGTKVDIIIGDEKDHPHHNERHHDHDHTHEHHHNHHPDHSEEHAHSCNHDHTHDHSHDVNLAAVEKIIEASGLAEEVKALSKKIFHHVAVAEAKVHGKPLEEVHFHEVGAVDSILDIVGTAICFHELEIDKVVASPLHTGTGFVKCQHGMIPVPVPATMEILKENTIPFYSTGIRRELVTPTGAAIIAGLVDEFGPMPEMKAEAVAYGAGTRDLEIPNMLRMVVGEKKKDHDQVLIMEANIDDMSGELMGHAMERLMEAGARDVFFTPIFMKKNRPATKLEVICDESYRDLLQEILLTETSTIGIRMHKVDRVVMQRKSLTVKTEYGTLRVKKAIWQHITKYAPEYEDCRKAALKYGVSLREIYQVVQKACQIEQEDKE